MSHEGTCLWLSGVVEVAIFRSLDCVSIDNLGKTFWNTRGDLLSLCSYRIRNTTRSSLQALTWSHTSLFSPAIPRTSSTESRIKGPFMQSS